ncbi:MAG: 16S rRNA (guanine(966)-N(2))-methyltransferase RsmD, partial [Eubacteriales bacterium]|nr:16S rRNA (guanine(966)-N(2))-methyltransferase RsmD [Eubacteriales bacterium]
MRVISGTRRHILLQTVNNLSIRPTTDKIKETLFNIIQFQIQDTNVLDLFAGSGALGIECLSRGSLHATFVDNNKQAINCINYNIEKTNFKEVSNVFHMSALQFIKYKNNYCYDIVFLDPPYDKNLYIDIFILWSSLGVFL